MLITENQNKAMWTKMLTEQFHVEDNEKLNWVSDYAQTHAMFEANLGAHAVATPAGVTPVTVPAGGPGGGGPGVGPMYATPANTLGMGNIAAPSGPHGADGRGSSTAGINPGAFFNQTPGSGDIPVSTLPMALNVALMTIGLELVPTIPTKGPWALLSYMDFPYAGGKMGRRNEIAGLDGVGAGRENKPMYFKVLLPGTAIAKLRALGTLVEDVKVDFETSAGKVQTLFKAFGRMDGGLLVQVIDSRNAANDKDISINEAFSGNAFKMTIGGAEVTNLEAAEKAAVQVDFAQTMVDFIDGFANFATGKKEPMTRAENETGTGNTIGLRLFSKWITVGSYEVTGAVTRQQLQDLPLYGVNAVSKIMEAMQNEITQSINARILEHVFRLGVTNALNLKNYQGVDLNLYMGTADKDFAQLPMNIKEYKDIFGNDLRATWGTIKNSEVNTSAENLHTRQRRIASRVLAASNLIQVTNRRGPANWVVTNTQVVTALQDCAQYVVAPMQNTFTQSVTANLYKAGQLAGLQVYVDPYMDWNDTRICVGRKGSGNEPGVVFMPYILADQMSLVAEGTMAPKMLVNSRYAIADIGFFPEKSYLTFTVSSDFGLL